MRPDQFNNYTVRLALILFMGSVSAQTPSYPPSSASIQADGKTMTRLVQVYDDLEKSLAEATRNHEVKLLNEMISSDFQCKTADGLMIDKTAWLKLSINEQALLQDMSVHNLDGVDVVSFVQIHKTNLRKRWVVDVWKSGIPPQLLLRQQSEWMNPGRALPFNRPGSPQIKAPDGKG